MPIIKIEKIKSALAYLRPRKHSQTTVFSHDIEMHRILRYQSDAGFKRLKFSPDIEKIFSKEFRDITAGTRLLVLVFVTLLFASLPSTIKHVWMAPSTFSYYYAIVTYPQLLIVVAALIVVWRRPVSLWVDWLCCFVYINSAIAVAIMRVYGMYHGFDLPLMGVAIGVVALFFVVRIPFRFSIYWAAVALASNVYAELTYVTNITHDYTVITSLIVLFLITALSGYLIEYRTRKTWVKGHLIDYDFNHDKHTQLLNRQALINATCNSSSLIPLQSQYVGVVVVAFDRLRSFNQLYGHVAGDNAIKKLGNIASESIYKKGEFAGRYGSNSFILFWALERSDEVMLREDEFHDRIDHMHVEFSGHLPDKIVVHMAYHVMDMGGFKEKIKRPIEDVNNWFYSLVDTLLEKARSHSL